MSAAGFERVNVTHRKLFSVRAVNSLSSTSTTSGNALIAIARPIRLAETARPPPAPSSRSNVGACTASTPGRHDARLAEPVRQAQARSATRVGSVAARRPGGGDHHLRALVQARAASSRACRSSCASGSAGRVASRRAPAGAGRTPGCRGCRGRGSSSLATISRYLASDSCPWPRIALALRQQLLRLAARRVGHVALAADRQQQRMHAGRVDRVDRVHAGDHGRDDRAGELVDELRRRWCLPAAAGRRR